MMKKIIVQFLALAVLSGCFAWSSWGSTLQTRQSNLYPFQNSMLIQDDFFAGGNGSTVIGSLGWQVTGGGTSTKISSETNRPGIYRLSTSAVNGTNREIFSLASTGIDPSSDHATTWIVRVNTVDADTAVRVGEQNAVNGNPPNNGIYFEKLLADTNWHCVTRAASTESRNDSGVSVSANFTTLTFTRNSTGVSFSINGTPVCPSHTANIPSSFVSPTVYIINGAAAVKTIDIDYFQMFMSGLTR